MTALIDSHTQNKELRTLGARISRSQSDEIKFMKRWLTVEAEPTSPPMHHMPGMDMSSHSRCSCPECLRKADGRFEKSKGPGV